MPPTFPASADFKVAHGTSLEQVSLASVVDLSKPTVLHLVTDYCAVTEANLKHLSTKADEFPDVNFVAILWFLGGSNSKQFFCPADRKGVDCNEDEGQILKEVVAYLPSGSKVKVVQDIQKPVAYGSSADSDACKDDVGADNCKTMKDSGFTCDDASMKDNCKATCEICKAAPTTTTQAPAFVPKVCDYYCGAVWNQYGSTGSVESNWDQKDQIITYAPGGCYLTTVIPPSSPNGVPGPKMWEGELKTKVDEAIAAAAKAKNCEGGVAASTSGAAKDEATASSPSPAPSDDGGSGKHDHDDAGGSGGTDSAPKKPKEDKPSTAESGTTAAKPKADATATTSAPSPAPNESPAPSPAPPTAVADGQTKTQASILTTLLIPMVLLGLS